MSDEERIREVLSQFIQLRDDKRFDDWVNLFTEDGTFAYLSNKLVGRAAIKAHVEALLQADKGKHLCVNSIIRIHGDEADAVSDFVKLEPDEASVEAKSTGGIHVAATGRYRDRLVRRGSAWKLAARQVTIAGYGEPSRGVPGRSR
jgi:uncharacterized protein (TIGR02246 family)